MGFLVYTSHAYPTLVDALCSRLIEETRSADIRETVVVVPNHRIANWLSNRIADRLGICLNIRFSYLDSLFAEDQQDDTGESHDNARLVWTLDILRGIEQGEIKLPFDPETTGESVAAQYAWDFAGQLGKYAEFRPSWLDEWSAGSGNPSQSIHRQCWQTILRAGHETCERLLAIGQRLEQTNPEAPLQANSLHLFGFWEISPARWTLLESLYPYTPIHAYLSFPSQTYLVDLTRKNLQLPLFDEEDDTLLNPRYRLLSRLASRGRAFQAFLLDQNTHSEQLHTALPDGRPILKSLQRLLIEPESKPAGRQRYSGPDTSVQIHSCANRKREVEVVKARIQQALLDDPSLRLEDIHVYAPDIGEYAPWIPIVFSEKESRCELSYGIRESLEPEQIPVFHTLLSLIDIQHTQWSAEAIRELLMQESIRQQYGLQEADVEQIASWVSAAGIVSGRQDRGGDPGSPDRYYSWPEGLDRLIQRYASEPEDPFQDKYRNSPTDNPEIFEAFLHFFRDLEACGSRLQEAVAAPETLIRVLRQITQTFVPEDFHPYEQSVLQKSLMELEDALKLALVPKLSIPVLAFLLRKSLPHLPLPTSLNRKSGIQFSSIRYEELVPARITILMGMSEGSFPRNDPQRSHDLMQAENPQFGDPSIRETDLYWLLQSVVLTGDQWIATYLGQDEFSNESRPASNALQAIAETINTVLAAEYADAPMPLFSITSQPRFPYEEDCFGKDALKRHFEMPCYYAATHIRNPSAVFEFLDGSLSVETTPALKDISIPELVRFFTQPARYYCETHLDLRLPRFGEEEPEHEPLLWTGDSLKDYQKMRICIEAALKGISAEKTKSRLIEDSLLPIGLGGDLDFEALWTEARELVNEWRQELHLCVDPNELEWTTRSVGDYQIQVPRLKEASSAIGLVVPAKLKKKYEIEAWIFSLGLWMASAEADPPVVTLIAKDRSRTFEAPEDPESVMLELLKIRADYETGLLPFFPETSYSAQSKNPKPEELLEKSPWIGFRTPGESDDAYNRMVLPASGNPFTPAFYEVARQIYALMGVEEKKRKGASR